MLVVTTDKLAKRGRVDRFYSVSEFIAKHNKDWAQAGRGWAGGVSFSESLEYARIGDTKAVEEAEKIMMRIESGLVATAGYQTVYSPFGPRASVSRWIAGSPMPCKRRPKRSSDIGPIKVIVTISCSAGIDAGDMAKRGAAIIAFLLALQSIRPVELYALVDAPMPDGDGWRYALIGIDSKPISTSQAGFVIGHPGFFRHLGHSWKKTGAWPEDRGTPGYENRLAMRLGLDEEDIIIPEVFMGDELISDPLSWIDAQLDKILGRMAEL